MKDENIILIGEILGNLTNNMVETTRSIDMTQKLFAGNKIVIKENYAEDFVTALTKLFETMNKCEMG